MGVEFSLVSKIKRRNEWDKKADLGVLVGYQDVGYKVLLNNKVIVAKHVDIIEENVKLIGFKENYEIDENNLIDNEINQKLQNEIEENQDNEFDENEINKKNADNLHITKNENLKVLRSSERKKSPVNKYGNPITNCIYVNYVSVDTPENYNDAINRNDSDKWQEAMNYENECLNANDTWNLVKKPKDREVLDLKWIYTKKGRR